MIDELPCDERKIQSFIYDNLKHLDTLIRNYEETYEYEIDLAPPESGSFEDFIKQFILENFIKSVRKFRCFSPIGEEVPVIETKGRHLSIDILANNYETGEFLIIEIKRSYNTEREAITELLAYVNGVRSKFPELSTGDIVIVIIAHNWQPILWNATIFLMIFFGLHIIPIQIMNVDYDKAKAEIRDISLEILIPPKKGNLTTLQNFTKECMTSKVFSWSEPRIKQREVANLVSIEMSRRNMHGFVVGLKFLGADSYPHPYGVLINALNPYSVAKYQGTYTNLKETSKKQEKTREKIRYEDIFDFNTIRISDVFNKKSIEALSLDELEAIWANRLDEVTDSVREFFKHTDYKPIPSTEVGYYYFSQLGEAGVSTLYEWLFINYTGVFHDFIVYRSILDWKIKEKQGCPDFLFGDIGSSAFQTYYSIEYFLELIEWFLPSAELGDK